MTIAHRLPWLRESRVHPGYLVLVVCLFASALVFGDALRPNRFWSDDIGDPVYAKLVPRRFGAWVAQPGSARVIVNPVQAEMLEKIYSETVSRVYVNQVTGRAVMLSMAYGKDQSTDTQLHTPEMCYPSQGFRVEGSSWHELKVPGGSLLLKRLNAVMGQRHEPLTYFIRTGDFITTRGSLDRNLARLHLAVRGFKVDGLLVRVSEVTQQPDAYEVQEAFLSDLIAALPPSDRYKLLGRIGLPRP